MVFADESESRRLLPGDASTKSRTA